MAETVSSSDTLQIIELDVRALQAEARAATWEARYKVLLQETALREGVIHEVTHRHRLVLSQPLSCRDCGWTGRSNPYVLAGVG